MSDQAPPEHRQLPRKASPEDGQWANKAEEMRFNALTRIQASAEKWGGTVSTLTGLFSIVALVKGREDVNALPNPLWYVVIGSLGLAVLSAAYAVYQAALSAQGTPRRFAASNNPANNPQDFYTWYDNETQKAAAQLNRSRIAVIPAFLLLAIAIGITWFSPVEQEATSGSNLLVTQTEGTVICGELTTDATGKLMLKGKGGSLTALDKVISLNTIEKCP